MAKYVGLKVGKVHEGHVISEYYCGGCGYPVTDHDSFCPECGGAFRECDASNLEEENAKLRELVRDALMSRLLYGIYRCPDEDMPIGDAIEWADSELRSRAEELGVELEMEV